MSTTYHLSPLCVLHAAPDAPEIVLHHAHHGTRYRVSSELFDAIGALLRGATLDQLTRSGGTALREALDTLIEEEVILDEGAFERLGAADLFRNRLGPIPLTVQRSFTEGGFVGDARLRGPAPPLRRDTDDVPAIPLASHGIDQPSEPFLDVLRSRRSRRDFAPEPLALGTLEQFLEIAARMHSVEGSGAGEVGFRAFPSGGARQPLEIYPVVRSVEALDAGFYRYDAFEHRLLRLPDHPAEREALFAVARRNLGLSVDRSVDPSVLFAVTAVVARTCWRYEGIEYQLMLQEVGALYQTFYLAATHLGLAPCAIGAFPELAMAELLNVDPLDEIQVGLFALGVAEDG